MDTEKIIQIIPAPANMWAKHTGVDGGRKYACLSRVVCLALTEDADSRYVRPMTISTDGIVDFPDECGDFDEIVGSWKESTHD